MSVRFRIAAVAATVAALAVAFAGNAGAASKPKAKPSPTRGVVLVDTNLAYQGAAAAGTGIVLTASGEVLTNNHVIRGATTISVTVPATKRRYSAHVVGYDVLDDVALLKLDGASGLATATRGSSAKLRVGQTTTAVGNANGSGRLVVTTGRITGLGQTVAVNDDEGGTVQMRGLIGTSATLVPGDSGGPLLDAAGRVIGVDAVGSSSYARGPVGGYAIPIDKAMSLVRLMETSTSTSTVHIGDTPFVGVTLRETEGGLLVGSVVDGGAAATAGIAAGSVLTTFDGTTLDSLGTLRSALFAHHPGDTVEVGYVDSLGNEATATLVLGTGPPQ